MEILNYIIIALFSYWISGIIHELGHVLTGLINGWKFFMLVVGPVGLKRNNNDKIVMYFEKHVVLWGGVGGTLPVNENIDNIKIWAKILMGGPLVSIVTGCIILPLGIIVSNILLLLIGAMSLGMGIMCALPLPLKTGITYTDGGRWSRLHKGGQGASEEIAIFKLMEFDQLSKDDSQLEYSNFEPLINATLDELKYYGFYYSYRYYKSQKDETNMNKSLEILNLLKKKVSSLVVDDCKI